jgi:hypothetical protein
VEAAARLILLISSPSPPRFVPLRHGSGSYGGGRVGAGSRRGRKLFDAPADGGEELALALDAAQRPLPLATAHRRKLIHR